MTAQKQLPQILIEQEVERQHELLQFIIRVNEEMKREAELEYLQQRFRHRLMQEEIECEAEIDRIINSKLRRFLKHNKQFIRVDTKEECTAIIIFNRDDLSKYNMFLYKDQEPIIRDLETYDRITVFYLKNKNKHDVKKHTSAYIKNRVPYKNSTC